MAFGHLQNIGNHRLKANVFFILQADDARAFDRNTFHVVRAFQQALWLQFFAAEANDHHFAAEVRVKGDIVDGANRHHRRWRINRYAAAIEVIQTHHAVDVGIVFQQPGALDLLRHEARDALVQRAAPVDERCLRRDFADRFVTEDTVRWDASRRALSAQRESRFDQIVFDARPAGRVEPALAAAALTDAVRDLGLDALPWPESLRQWRERVRCLRDWMPDLGLPDLSDDALMATLDDWLQPAFAGKTRLDALGEDDLANALKSGLDWSLRQRIDALAPTRITVPSGMERRIEYAHGQPPVLAVKLQELFGLADTPRVADDRVPVLLHLLSPGGKPLQVTSDLRNFWNSTYAEVKKEMKGRYPKHPWPDDPWSAQATHRAKPRGT